jgi:riboflavin-specific deaminase-like protein
LASSKPYPSQTISPQTPESQGIDDRWEEFLSLFFSADTLPSSEFQVLFEPIRTATVDSMMVVGQIGQTMDGRIATVTGQSKYVNGPSGLLHLHRLRALVDAVVIGVGTAIADDPQLNVRLVQGRSPARVIIDPQGRLGTQSRVWCSDGARRIWIVAQGTKVTPPLGVEVLTLPMIEGRIQAKTILNSLSQQGLHRTLIEGGALTLSHFMQAGCLDRLHIITAPIIMGSGRPSFQLPAIEHMDQATRLKVQTYLLGNDILLDCDLSDQRLT